MHCKVIELGLIDVQPAVPPEDYAQTQQQEDNLSMCEGIGICLHAEHVKTAVHSGLKFPSDESSDLLSRFGGTGTWRRFCGLRVCIELIHKVELHDSFVCLRLQNRLLAKALSQITPGTGPTPVNPRQFDASVSVLELKLVLEQH